MMSPRPDAAVIALCACLPALSQDWPVALAKSSIQEPAGTGLPRTEDSAEEPGPFSLWQRRPANGTISTDRPGFADTTAVMPRGYLQLELGYTFTYDSEDRVRSQDHAIGQANLRLGLLNNLEFRTLWSGFSMTETEFDAESSRTGRRFRATDYDDGAGDVTLGLRTQLLENDGFVPDLTFLTNLSIPVGSDSKSAGDIVPDVRLVYGWALTDKLRLYGVGIAAAAVDHEGRFFQGAGSAGLTYVWTERFSTFVEYYGIYPGGRDSDCAHAADGGLAFLLNNNTQIDVSAGIGLNEEAADFFIGFGVSFRW